MNRFFKNMGLLFGLSLMVFLACDKRPTDERWQAEIRYFFLQHQEDYTSYEPLDFQKIDLAFLESQQPIQKALLVLQDTTKMRIQQLHLANETDEIELLASFSEPFSIDLIDEYLKVRASAEGKLSKHGTKLNEAYAQALLDEEDAVEQLAYILGQFSLSIYSLDFENDPIIFWHRYLLDEEERSAIFELDRASAEVISFREVS